MTALADWNFAGRTDAELAAAAAAGDRGAFAGIYDRYADRLDDFCVGIVRDRDAAADCVQEVFCTVAARLPQLREPSKLRPWLYSIARREALRCMLQRRREQPSDDLPDAPSADAGPDTLAVRTELADLIAQAAGGLPDRDRSVMKLAYGLGLDGPQLAEALGVSPANANRMVSRLREMFVQCLGALLVARRAHTANGCPQLGAILAGWDGNLTILMRKRVVRHIESCPTCDQDRRRDVNPVALLGPVPAEVIGSTGRTAGAGRRERWPIRRPAVDARRRVEAAQHSQGAARDVAPSGGGRGAVGFAGNRDLRLPGRSQHVRRHRDLRHAS